MTSAAQLTDRDAFFEAVRAAELLTNRQFERAKSLARLGTAATAAASLVSAGLLTRFQADRLLAGRTDGFLLGQYVILELVGRGTMSRVYKAKHRAMNRTVAIKILSAELTRTPAERENFQREILGAGSLTHPNIVTAYDASEWGDRFFFVLEFVNGPNLAAHVRRRGPLPVADAFDYVRQAAAGLQHAHERGMVHRDLKPQNLLAARPSPSAPVMVKIADFGIPKATRGSTDFAAPELEHLPADAAEPRSDLYSLGCIFQFLLTGRTPRENHLPVRQLRPEVPPEVAALVQKLTAPDPDARFSSAAELLTEMDALCVPTPPALPDAQGWVNLDLLPHPLTPGRDSGYLTGRVERPVARELFPGSGTVRFPLEELSPWAQLTDEVAEGDTAPVKFGETPSPPAKPEPRSTPRPPGRETVSWSTTVMLMLGVLLLCLMGIGAALSFLPK